MKKIEVSRIVNNRELKALLSYPAFYRTMGRLGYYEHNGKLYRFEGEMGGADYYTLVEGKPDLLGEEFIK